MKAQLCKLLLGSCVFLTACGPLIPIPGEAPKRYTLSYWEATEDRPKIARQLIVDVPTASIKLDSQRVAVIPAFQQIDYYADMEWSDRLPLVVQEAVSYSLQNLHVYRAVVRNSDGIVPDHALKIDIRKFDVDQTTTPRAEIEYFVQLIDLSTRNEVASKLFSAHYYLTHISADTIAAALNAANKQVIWNIHEWLVKG
ncbi:ABC-type transport auxiliary lipoprotein family protein [Candidatus Odyssella thessalonicensis]|uniref:ABC-type transport auxiliary lipoprotein family protein n=1 Tax=Candidatus Odyssella thessalonicensis TaxID=84647 RepID=UPI000225C216|nr:ABC-type transport auxiliary lipoprotein family protein [Candidatus Odyssella thessalonicensis]